MLSLIKMTQNSFNHYISSAIETFASEKVANGTLDEENAISNSKKQYDELLPCGLETPDNYFYDILNKEQIIGYIWIAKSRDNHTTAFIYDFEIYDKFQNTGYGSNAIELIGIKAKELGFTSLALHVFGSNSRAIHVYTKTGFEITDINMQKKL